MALRRSRLHHAVTMVALPGIALGAALAALPLTPAQAQSVGADLKVLNPHAGDTLGANAFSLDVSFHSTSGSPVTTAELWVDGVRWVRRDLDAPQIKNVLSFAIDSSTLSEGEHAFQVRVLCANGSVGETVLHIAAGNNAGVIVGSSDGPDLKFETPGNGRHVMGQVELLLDAHAQNGQNPWITIYVDKKFKTLKNFPPYSYEWDTSTVANGFHTIEATGFLDKDSQSTTRRIQVYVDNAGGNTELKQDIPDLSVDAPTAAKSAAAASHLHRSSKVSVKTTRAAHLAASSSAASSVDSLPVGFPTLAEPTGLASDVLSVGIVPITIRHHAASPVHSLTLDAPSASVATVAAPHHAVYALHERVAEAAASTPHVVATMAQRTIPVSAASIVEVSRSLSATRRAEAAPLVSAATPSASLRPITSGMIRPAALSPELPISVSASTDVAMPEVAMSGLRTLTSATHHDAYLAPRIATAYPSALAFDAPTVSPVTTIAAPVTNAEHVRLGRHSHRRHYAHAGLRAVLRPLATGMMNVHAAPQKLTQVAFDGQQIAFDVQPRVEAGLPIAPFRQIFEHTGGQVDWVPQTQVVHAINSTHEIVITVGKNTAQVNGQNVTMARPAFVEKGRTIVPLSFVGAALDVNVKYDPTTGHLQIMSK